jgi:hypothetical protein
VQTSGKSCREQVKVCLVSTSSTVMPRECGASSTPRLPGSSTAVSGILDRPVPATPTAFVRRRTSAVKRLRRGSAVVARRSFSEGGKPGEDR